MCFSKYFPFGWRLYINIMVPFLSPDGCINDISIILDKINDHNLINRQAHQMAVLTILLLFLDKINDSTLLRVRTTSSTVVVSEDLLASGLLTLPFILDAVLFG